MSVTKIMRHLPRMYQESLAVQCRQSLGGVTMGSQHSSTSVLLSTHPRCLCQEASLQRGWAPLKAESDGTVDGASQLQPEVASPALCCGDLVP